MPTTPSDMAKATRTCEQHKFGCPRTCPFPATNVPMHSLAASSAVQAFEEACRAEDLLTRKLAAHENAAMLVPEEDRAWYIEATEAIRRKYEAKQEARPALYESRLSRLLRRKKRA